MRGAFNTITRFASMTMPARSSGFSILLIAATLRLKKP